MTNKEKALITYKALQKKKFKKAKIDNAAFDDFKREICAKARKRTRTYR